VTFTAANELPAHMSQFTPLQLSPATTIVYGCVSHAPSLPFIWLLIAVFSQWPLPPALAQQIVDLFLPERFRPEGSKPFIARLYLGKPRDGIRGFFQTENFFLWQVCAL
jgi:hypothetical protein